MPPPSSDSGSHVTGKPDLSLIVERVGPEGFRIVAALYALAFDDPWPEPSVRELLSTPGTMALIASRRWEGGTIPSGFLVLRCILDESEVLAVGVSPSDRRGGIGRALMLAGLARAEQAGVAEVFLEVGKDNPAALALYHALGFTQVGSRKNYYRRKDRSLIDALIMKKKIAD